MRKKAEEYLNETYWVRSGQSTRPLKDEVLDAMENYAKYCAKKIWQRVYRDDNYVPFIDCWNEIQKMEEQK